MNRFFIKLLVLGVLFQKSFCSTCELDEQKEFRIFVQKWEADQVTQEDSNQVLKRSVFFGYESTVESLLCIPETLKGPNLVGIREAVKLASCPKILALLMMAPASDNSNSADVLLSRIAEEAGEIKRASILFSLPVKLKPSRGCVLSTLNKAIDLSWVGMVELLSKQKGYFEIQNIIEKLENIATNQSISGAVAFPLIQQFAHKGLNRDIINRLCTVASEYMETKAWCCFFLCICR